MEIHLKIVIYDKARVNGGTNYDALGEDMMTLGHTNAALLSLLEFVFNIRGCLKYWRNNL